MLRGELEPVFGQERQGVPGLGFGPGSVQPGGGVSGLVWAWAFSLFVLYGAVCDERGGLGGFGAGAVEVLEVREVQLDYAVDHDLVSRVSEVFPAVFFWFVEFCEGGFCGGFWRRASCGDGLWDEGGGSDVVCGAIALALLKVEQQVVAG